MAAAVCRAVGVNVDLAPVLDVAYARGNFIDRYERSYGSDPAAVGRLAATFIVCSSARARSPPPSTFRGSEPRRGTTTPISARSPSTLLVGLRSVDEAPYRAAIAAGARIVMLSWATYPALDPRLPAGLSPTVIGGELRGRLGFRGVTMTDAIGAGALDRFGGVAQRAVLAARAGADLILTSNNVAEGESVDKRPRLRPRRPSAQPGLRRGCRHAHHRTSDRRCRDELIESAVRRTYACRSRGALAAGGVIRARLTSSRPPAGPPRTAPRRGRGACMPERRLTRRRGVLQRAAEEIERPLPRALAGAVVEGGRPGIM